MSLPVLQHVVIGDQSPVEAIGIASILRRVARCDRISAVQDFSSLLRALQPDVDLILVDADLPGYSPLESLPELRAAAPSARLALLTAGSIPGMAPLLDAGIRGFLPKQLAANEMMDAIRLVVSGQIYLPAAMWDAVSHQRAPTTAPHNHQFSDRQGQVLALASEGYSNKEIGAKLNISESTVKVHISAVLRVLGVTNRGRAVAAFNAMKAKGGAGSAASGAVEPGQPDG